MSDTDFRLHRSRLDSPAFEAFAIVPNDSEDLPYVTRGVYVGGNGDINAIVASGSTVLFKNVVAGTVLPIRVSRVLAAATTATNIVGLV